jgi:hypothetical protein
LPPSGPLPETAKIMCGYSRSCNPALHNFIRFRSSASSQWAGDFIIALHNGFGSSRITKPGWIMADTAEYLLDEPDFFWSIRMLFSPTSPLYYAATAAD